MKNFTVHMLVFGSDRSADPDAPESFVYEIQERSHLSNGQAAWDEDKSNAIRIALSTESSSANLAAQHISEEMLEIASACIMGVGHISVEVVDVIELGSSR